jgi:nitroreductase
MELDKAIYERHSVRSFKDKKVSWKDVLDCVDAALQAPCAGNNYNLNFTIVEDPKRIKQLAEDCDQLWIQEAPTVVVVSSNNRNLKSMYGERGLRYGHQQAGAAIQNFLLKVNELGLSTCWIGAYDDDLICSRMNVPSDMKIEAILPIGYAKAQSKGKKISTRRPKLDNNVWWNNWQQKRRDYVFREPPRHTTPVVFGEK